MSAMVSQMMSPGEALGVSYAASARIRSQTLTHYHFHYATRSELGRCALNAQRRLYCHCCDDCEADTGNRAHTDAHINTNTHGHGHAHTLKRNNHINIVDVGSRIRTKRAGECVHEDDDDDGDGRFGPRSYTFSRLSRPDEHFADAPEHRGVMNSLLGATQATPADIHHTTPDTHTRTHNGGDGDVGGGSRRGLMVECCCDGARLKDGLEMAPAAPRTWRAKQSRDVAAINESTKCFSNNRGDCCVGGEPKKYKIHTHTRVIYRQKHTNSKHSSRENTRIDAAEASCPLEMYAIIAARRQRGWSQRSRQRSVTAHRGSIRLG